MNKFLFLIYGAAIGVVGTLSHQAHQPEQVYRVTCNAQKYGFTWGTAKQIFGNVHGSFHCFKGAEVAKVDSFGEAPAVDLFDRELSLTILPPIVSAEVLAEEHADPSGKQ